MDTLRRFVIIWLVIAIVVGLGIGLTVGWQVWPVSWYDTDPSDLKTEHQVSYILMTADSLAVNGDSDLAVTRVESLLDDQTTAQDLADLVESVAIEADQNGDPAAALRVRRLALAASLPTPLSVNVPVVPSSRPSRVMAPSRVFVTFGALLIFAVAVALVAWAAIRLLRRRKEPENEWLDESPSSDDRETVPPITDVRPPNGPEARPLVPPIEPIEVSPHGEANDEQLEEPSLDNQVDVRPIPADDLGRVEHVALTEPADDAQPPELTIRHEWEDEDVADLDVEDAADETEDESVVQGSDESETDDLLTGRSRPELAAEETLGTFDAEYRYGDDDYDVSFHLYSDDDEFLGECGMSGQCILKDDGAQQIGACELWLYDKYANHTESRILVSEYVYTHEGLSAELSEKGDLIVPEMELSFLIVTLTLQMTVTVKALAYLPDAEEPESVFENLAVELVVERSE